MKDFIAPLATAHLNRALVNVEAAVDTIRGTEHAKYMSKLDTVRDDIMEMIDYLYEEV